VNRLQGTGVGYRGERTACVSRERSEMPIQSRVSGVDSAERYPPHPPAPLPRGGEGSRRSRLVAVLDELVEEPLSGGRSFAGMTSLDKLGLGAKLRKTIGDVPTYTALESL
jgi:hypothetical protein